MAVLISFIMLESPGLSWSSWIRWAWTGATANSMGVFSSSMTTVANFMGFTDSADIFFSFFLTSCDSRAAVTAGCCHMCASIW